MAEKKEKQIVYTPEGRLINGHLTEKNAYVDSRGKEGTPAYKVEMAFDPDDMADFEDAVVAAAVAKWGSKAEADYDSGKIQSPLKDGDEMAGKREDKGKTGDAYKGKLVLRASTFFNAVGDDAPGGAKVFNEDAVAMQFAEREKVYNGSLGIAAVVLDAWENDKGERGVKAYLYAYQYTGEGERLRSESAAVAFKPVGRTTEAAADGGGRRARRKG